MENFTPTLPMAPGGPFNVPAGSFPRYTTAQLLALSTGASEKQLVAYCTDCYSSEPDSAAGFGDICLWSVNSARWITFHDRVSPTTDWLTFALSIARRGDANRQNPFLTVAGDAPSNTAGLTQYVSGTGATGNSNVADGLRLFSFASTPGTTSTGIVRAIPVYFINTTSNTQPVRSIACVMSWYGAADSVSAAGVNDFHWRVGLQTTQFSATAALQNDDCGFIMDDRNTLGLGASGANLRALVRIAGSTLDYIDTSIAVASGSAFLITTWEWTGPTANQGRMRVASANNFGSTITTYADRNAVLGGTSLQAAIATAKTVGTGSRNVNRNYLKFIASRASASGSLLA